MFIRGKLPERHLTGDSKDVIKLATALIGTMSALVLALLFACTRTSFEKTSATVSRMTADIVELDQLLEEYGPEGQPVRVALRAEIGPWVDSIWREAAQERGGKGMARPTGRPSWTWCAPSPRRTRSRRRCRRGRFRSCRTSGKPG